MMRNAFKSHLMDLDQQHQTELQFACSDNSQSLNSHYYTNSSGSNTPQYTTLEVHQQPQHLYHIQSHTSELVEPHSMSFSYAPQITVPADVSKVPTKPKLVILEQPADKFRFRYSSEMHGTHGSLMGEHTMKNQKSYPQVNLEGYYGKAVIRCTLYQEKKINPSPHSHSLVVRKNDRDECDPHYFEVDGSKNLTTIKCQGMGIIHTAKKEIIETLRTKLEVLYQKEFNAEIGSEKSREYFDKAESEAKAMNLNQVRLCFEALKKEPNGKYTSICEPVYSNIINNMKSALTGEVKICRLSAAVSSAEGGDDLFLLVEKVNKKNIKVRFFQEENGETIWEDWGIFSETDVHHQYAIALRTPPYKDKDIEQVVDVQIQLVRESDQDKSEPKSFKYKPRHAVSSRKRRRVSNSTLQSGELSTTNYNYNVGSVGSSEGSVGGMSISAEYGKEAILSEFHQLTSTEFNLCQKDVPGDSMELSAFICKLGGDSDELKNMMDPSILRHFEQNEGEMVVADGIVSKPHNFVLNEDLVIKQAKNFVNRVAHDEWTVEQAKSKIEYILNVYEKTKKENMINNLIANGNIKLTHAFFNIMEKIDFFEPLIRLGGSSSPLYISCLENQPLFIRSLLSHGCTPNTYDENGDNPLHIAAKDNHLECAKAIIETCKSKAIKLNINLENFDGLTCLHLAIRKGYLEMVKLLINQGEASAKVAISKTGNNSLMLAVEANQPMIVEFLLKCTEVKANAKNSSGLSALEMAKTSKANVIVKMLMNNMRISDPFMDIKEEPEDDSDSSTDNIDYLQWNEKRITLLSIELRTRWPALADAMELSYLITLVNTSTDFLKYISKEIYKDISKLKFSEYISKMKESTQKERDIIDQIIGLL